MSDCRCNYGQRFVLCPVHGAPPHWSDRAVAEVALKFIINLDGKVDKIMSNTDQLSADVQTLVDAFGTLSADLATGLTNLHAQIAGLEGGAGDAQALQAIGHNITNLIERAQQADALVKAADPGPQPDPEVPVAAPLPDDSGVPAPLETPESPATPPVPDEWSDGNVAAGPSAGTNVPPITTSTDVEAGPGAETPDASADPAAPVPEA